MKKSKVVDAYFVLCLSVETDFSKLGYFLKILIFTILSFFRLLNPHDFNIHETNKTTFKNLNIKSIHFNQRKSTTYLKLDIFCKTFISV